MHIRIIFEFFEKYKWPGITFFSSKVPDMFLVSSHILKQLDYVIIFTFI